MAITQNELNIANKSYTNKDFAQIYPELLDLCLKLTNQWNPDQSNESDPGIVLLKLAAFIADKNNYNIDKNVLECFMPSATQETSMRNLCEMNGYNIRYYNSAVTPISFMYTNTIANEDSFVLKKYDTVVTSEDGSVKYTLIEDCTIDKINQTYSADAIEGTFEVLNVGDSNVIQLSNLDDNNRIYFPERYVAENGIFITDTNSNNLWAKKDNLNIEELGQTIFKFGYDSAQLLPYIEFPSDIATLIGDGLIVRYVISSGISGNVSANTLNVLSAPDSVETTKGEVKSDLLDYLVINNLYATNDGTDPETIDEAYNGFKKTVGTFTTLVTCRDYANFIYNLVDETTLKYIVSNIHVADRRDDLNYSNNIVTYGLNEGKYVTHATENAKENNADNIEPFDICLYPLSPITTTYNALTYETSFKPILSANTILDEDPNLTDAKCISHNYKDLDDEDVYCIKNYYKLNAKISTYEKLNSIQQETLIDTVRNALYKAFNSREVDFGEEIPYDTILSTIKNADANINNVILSEPELTTYVMNKNSTEVELLNSSNPFAQKARLNIISKNVLSGTIDLFDINKNYSIEFGQKKIENDNETDENDNDKTIYSKIDAAKSEVKIDKIELSSQRSLKSNEVVQFIAPNLTTEKEYGSYVNYRFDPDPSREFNLLETEPSDWGTNYFNYYEKIEDNYVPLTESVTFVSNKYYEAIYEHNQFIPANTYYQLSGKEKLSFVYTDTDTKIEHLVTYDATTINIDGTITENVTNIFKSSLDIRPVESLINPVTITKNGVQYLVLGTSDTICREVYITSILDNSSIPCYWIMNNDTNTLFSATNVKEDNGKKYISVLLNNGEYFMYSNNAFTELVILGSGTRLTIDLSNYSNPTETFVDWSISSENMIDIDLINSNGLAAFGAMNWQNKTLTTTPIKIEDMQIKAYSEQDLIQITDCTNENYTGLDNSWIELTDATIKCTSNGTTETLEAFLNMTYEGKPIYWSGRSRLDLNCGPNKFQKLETNHTIQLRSLTDPENPYVLKGNSNQNYVLSFNTNVQFAGSNDWIDVRSRTVDGVKVSLVDGIEGLYFNKLENKYPKSEKEDYSNKEITRNNDGMMVINLAGFGASINPATPITLEHINFVDLDELLFVYYEATLVDNAPKATVTITSNGVIRHYGTTESTVTLNNGLNILEIPKNSTSTYLSINYVVQDDEESNDRIFIGKLKLINGLNNKIKYINEDGKMIPDSDDTILAKIKKLATVDGINIFNYTDNVMPNRELDVDYLLAPEAFWDANNIANGFTIGEIDFNRSTLNILKASQK